MRLEFAILVVSIISCAESKRNLSGNFPNRNISNPEKPVNPVIQGAQKLIQGAKVLCKNPEVDLELLFRNLDNIRGNSRTAKLTLVSQITHEVET